MMPNDNGFEDLKRRHPEWQPWLAVVGETLNEIANPKWDALVPSCAASSLGKVPLLAQVSLKLDQGSMRPTYEKLMRTAARSGSPKMASLAAAARADLDISLLLIAALKHDSDDIKEAASAAGADFEAFQAVAALLPMPLLHACNRRWSRSVPESWTEGYCPVCGAWPAFAEVRGIERSRYLRCGRCGAEWQAQCLFCPYCGMTDHNQLASLTPEQSGSKSVIDTCNRCLGYVKAFTVLQGSPPAKVMLDDLGTVELDVAAAEHGYKRPQGAGYSLHASVIVNGAAPLA
jgi:FdhE protein